MFALARRPPKTLLNFFKPVAKLEEAGAGAPGRRRAAAGAPDCSAQPRPAKRLKGPAPALPAPAWARAGAERSAGARPADRAASAAGVGAGAGSGAAAGSAGEAGPAGARVASEPGEAAGAQNGTVQGSGRRVPEPPAAHVPAGSDASGVGPRQASCAGGGAGAGEAGPSRQGGGAMQQLVCMGFGEEAAARALTQARGDVAQAANLLLA